MKHHSKIGDIFNKTINNYITNLKHVTSVFDVSSINVLKGNLKQVFIGENRAQSRLFHFIKHNYIYAIRHKLGAKIGTKRK